MAIVIGIDPLLYTAARYQVPLKLSEFDFAGGIAGEPIEVIEGKYTGFSRSLPWQKHRWHLALPQQSL